ncbi:MULTISPECIES: hypothetical protein [unclassified Streptomyces]|uniref:hypothetical protein n=1 Tax=unclassified Streptomyces TaxID=2593676 RepID=UPI001661B83B|nr:MULTISPECIES: hypothetical protein [unclassified Streptomyces]MBD0841170.1 hypothetical protein [Streptomyces sp. TRM68416]
MTTPTTTPAAHGGAGESPRRTLWPGLAGVASGVLMLVALLVIFAGGPDTEGRDGLRETLAFYSDDGNLDRTEGMAVMLLLSALLFLWFLGALARLAGNRSHLVLAGGAVYAALLMIATLAGSIYAISANNTDSFQVGPGTAMVALLLLDMAYAGFVAAMAAAAVLLFTVWRVAVTTRAVPAWLGWCAFAIAVLSLAGPFSAWLTVLLMPLWTLAAGLLLALRGPAAP